MSDFLAGTSDVTASAASFRDIDTLLPSYDTGLQHRRDGLLQPSTTPVLQPLHRQEHQAEAGESLVCAATTTTCVSNPQIPGDVLDKNV